MFNKRGREAPFYLCCAELFFLLERHAQSLHRVSEVDLPLVRFRQLEILDRAYPFADEHRPALRIERAVAREHDAVGSEEIQTAAQRRSRAAEHRVAIEHAEILDR